MPRTLRGILFAAGIGSFLSGHCRLNCPDHRETLMRFGLRLMYGMLLTAVSLCTAGAQEAAPFFKGKQIRILISAGVAGGYNEYARLLASHMGNHIAGKPDFIVQS